MNKFNKINNFFIVIACLVAFLGINNDLHAKVFKSTCNHNLLSLNNLSPISNYSFNIKELKLIQIKVIVTFIDLCLKSKIHTKYPNLFLKLIWSLFKKIEYDNPVSHQDKISITLTKRELNFLKKKKIRSNIELNESGASLSPAFAETDYMRWFLSTQAPHQLRVIKLHAFKALKRNVKRLIYNINELTETAKKSKIYSEILYYLKYTVLSLDLIVDALIIDSLVVFSPIKSDVSSLIEIFETLEQSETDDISSAVFEKIFQLVMSVNRSLKKLSEIFERENSGDIDELQDISFETGKMDHLGKIKTVVLKLYIQLLGMDLQSKLFNDAEEIFVTFEVELQTILLNYYDLYALREAHKDTINKGKRTIANKSA